MKRLSKDFLSGFIVAIIITSTVSVFATGAVSKAINVTYNNIKLVVDGKPVTFGKDSAGKRIEPFVYNGTTYLPVRSVGDAIGKKVNWDGATQTVYIGEKPGESSYMTEIIEPYNSNAVTIYNLNSSKKLDIAGIEYNTGYLIQTLKSKMQFNLNSKYKSLDFDIGPSTTFNNQASKMSIYLDDNLYKTFEITGNSPIESVSINVKDVNQIRFEAGYTSTYQPIPTKIGIGNPVLK